ncbi:MAG TPA: hypothetical protein VF604_02095 [Pyrinomonadaceae bacterium]|jgi:hypothetical protein
MLKDWLAAKREQVKESETLYKATSSIVALTTLFGFTAAIVSTLSSTTSFIDLVKEKQAIYYVFAALLIGTIINIFLGFIVRIIQHKTRPTREIKKGITKAFNSALDRSFLNPETNRRTFDERRLTDSSL